jgi:hypothetical protein
MRPMPTIIRQLCALVLAICLTIDSVSGFSFLVSRSTSCSLTRNQKQETRNGSFTSQALALSPNRIRVVELSEERGILHPRAQDISRRTFLELLSMAVMAKSLPTSLPAEIDKISASAQLNRVSAEVARPSDHSFTPLQFISARGKKTKSAFESDMRFAETDSSTEGWWAWAFQHAKEAGIDDLAPPWLYADELTGRLLERGVAGDWSTIFMDVWSKIGESRRKRPYLSEEMAKTMVDKLFQALSHKINNSPRDGQNDHNKAAPSNQPKEGIQVDPPAAIDSTPGSPTQSAAAPNSGRPATLATYHSHNEFIALDRTTGQLVFLRYSLSDTLTRDERLRAKESLQGQLWEHAKYAEVPTQIAEALDEDSTDPSASLPNSHRIHLSDFRFALSREGVIEGYIKVSQSNRNIEIMEVNRENRLMQRLQGVGTGLLTHAIQEFLDEDPSRSLRLEQVRPDAFRILLKLYPETYLFPNGGIQYEPQEAQALLHAYIAQIEKWLDIYPTATTDSQIANRATRAA